LGYHIGCHIWCCMGCLCTNLPQLKRLKSGHCFDATLQRGSMVLPAAIRIPRSLLHPLRQGKKPRSFLPRTRRVPSITLPTHAPSFPRGTIMRSSLTARRGCGGGRGAACSSATSPVAMTPYSLLNLASSPLPCAEHRCHHRLRSPDHGRVSAAAVPQAIARC
jgi:hypothetical protein